MAVKQVTIIECDRCHNEVSEDVFKDEGGRVQVMPTVKARGKSAQFHVWDLCPSCRVHLEEWLSVGAIDRD